jgi:hypothetical protein
MMGDGWLFVGGDEPSVSTNTWLFEKSCWNAAVTFSV